MALLTDAGRILDRSHASTDAITSEHDLCSSGTGVVLKCVSTVDGELTPQYVAFDGSVHDLSDPLPIAADDLAVVPIFFHVARLRAVFTPATSSAGTTFVDAYVIP